MANDFFIFHTNTFFFDYTQVTTHKHLYSYTKNLILEPLGSKIDMDTTKELTIVICDDSITNVLMLSQIVKDICSAEIIQITDPRKIAPTLANQVVDLLLLDIEMPHINGFDVLMNVRETYPQEVLPIIIITGVLGTETRNKALRLGANDFVTKPFDPVEISLRVKNLLKVQQVHKTTQITNQQLEQKVTQRTQELEAAVVSLMHCLAIAGELKNNETAQHVIRVGKYARVLAQGYGLPTKLAQMIEKTAPLHDIGKIGIPDNILLKKGKLTSEEQTIMKQHTLYGQKLIGSQESLLLQMAQSVALNHHERWDGSGYPNGLKGESIPIEGRIASLADVFDALTTKRPYKEAWSIERAINKIQQSSSTHFDPMIVEIFTQRIGEFADIMKEFADA